MDAGLIDLLLGHFLDGQAVADGDPARNRLSSIVDNLSRLFNTRRGSIAHLPDFGLPDISQVYRDLPYSIEGLRGAIRSVVEKYEPRLHRVRVEKLEKDKDGVYHLKPSISPEYSNDLYKDANYGLMGLRWSLLTLLSMDKELGFNDPQ